MSQWSQTFDSNNQVYSVRVIRESKNLINNISASQQSNMICRKSVNHQWHQESHVLKKKKKEKWSHIVSKDWLSSQKTKHSSGLKVPGGEVDKEGPDLFEWDGHGESVASTALTAVVVWEKDSLFVSILQNVCIIHSLFKWRFSLVSKLSAVFHFHLCRLVMSQVPVRDRSSSTFTSPMPRRTSCSQEMTEITVMQNSILKLRKSKVFFLSYYTVTLTRKMSKSFINTFRFMVTGFESSGSSPSSKRCMILNRTRS